VLTPGRIPTRRLLVGAAVAGVLFTLLQAVGGYLVGHSLKHAQQVYGFFAIVLGLMSWLFLSAQVTLYGAEVNVVRARRLWPRSILQPPLTEADQRALTDLAKQEERRPEQAVNVEFTPQANDPRPRRPRALAPRPRPPLGRRRREPSLRGVGERATSWPRSSSPRISSPSLSSVSPTLIEGAPRDRMANQAPSCSAGR
jgi:Virulence factor BrkB